MTRPLRVLIDADTHPVDIDGAARLAAGRGHEVHVVAPSDTGVASFPVQEDGVPTALPGRTDSAPACLPACPAAAGAQRTAPVPRAVELLGARTRLSDRAVASGIDLSRVGANGVALEPELEPTVLFVARSEQEKRGRRADLRVRAGLPADALGRA